MLKYIALAIAAAIAIVLVLAAMKPDTFTVARKTAIKAPPEKIFPYVNDLKAFGTWSPYEKKDPNMKRIYTGPQAGKGAIYAWEGNKEIGQGSMEITESTAPGKVGMKLDFLKPFEAHNKVDFTMVPKGDSTEVTWAMTGPVPFVAKIFHVFMNMDKMVGTDFEVGLANLKALAEK
jgi:hypothetical protein